MNAMRQITSLVTEGGQLQLSVIDVDRPEPKDDEVLVRVDASPINPSDLRMLLAGAELSTLATSGSDHHPVLTARLPDGAVKALAGRVGTPMPVGSEGAGVVVEAGASPAAQALLGKIVGARGGGMYAEYCSVAISRCVALPDGTDPRAGASMFVNPLTVLGMVETMRNEGHTALVHTAAASNLGQMLIRLCIAEGIPLVNIVRREPHVELLRSIGATHVVNSGADSYEDDLRKALIETGATLGFDATGGGELASQILAGIEAAANAKHDGGFSWYGSTTGKQVYIYGGLDHSPTVLRRNFGMKWNVGGWLLPHFLESIGAAAERALCERVAREVETTFASSYTGELPLAAVLDPTNVSIYARQATGEKFLVTPHA